MCAQITHAAGESVAEEVPIGTNAVVLSVKDEFELRQISKQLSAKAIKHILIQEIDPPYDGQATAIGVSPIAERNEIRKVLSKLALLK